LAARRKPVPASKRIQQINRNSMLGVMVVSLATLFVSIGGLGATGYYLFTNVDSRATNRVQPTPPTRTTTPSPTTSDSSRFATSD